MRFSSLLMTLKQYVKEVRYLKSYILIVTLTLVIFWTLHFVLSKEIMVELGEEDGILEWLTAIGFLISSILFFILFLKTKNIFYFLLFVVLLIGVGEEISWGYRIFHYKLPDSIEKTNVSNEFNLHNIEIFNTMDFQNNNKHGFDRLLEVEFLFKIFTLVCCVLLPFIVYQVNWLHNLTVKIKLPVPPISIGLFFILNYLAYKISNTVLFNEVDKFNNGYIYSFVESFEWIESVIILAITLYFYNKRDIIIPGNDLKHFLPSLSSTSNIF